MSSIKSFPYEGVHFRLPDNVEVSKERDYPPFIPTQIGRIVMQFTIDDRREKKPDRADVEMWVKFNSWDMFRAQDADRPMELRITKDKGATWVTLNNVVLHLEPDGTCGYGIVLIKTSDPAVGWFP